jgi:hypothetical protein
MGYFSQLTHLFSSAVPAAASQGLSIEGSLHNFNMEHGERQKKGEGPCMADQRA